MKANNFGKHGWWIIIFTLFIYMFTSTAPDILNVTTTGFAERFGMASGDPLLIFAAIGGFVGIPLALIVGQVISKKGVKGPAVVLLFILAIVWFLYGRCETFTQYAVIATIVAALANVGNLVITQQLMSNWFPKKKGTALGWATVGMPLDSAITVAVFQALIVKKGLSAPFYMMCIIFVILAIVMIIAVKAYPEEAGAYPDNEPISEEERKANLEALTNYKSEITVGKMFKIKDFWLLVITFGFLFIGLIGIMSQMVPRMVSIGLDTNSAIMWLTIASVVGIPGSIAWGIVDQKIGTKKTTIIFSALWAIMTLLAAIGCGMGSIPISIASVVMVSCLQGGLGNLMPSMVINVFGRYDFAQANKLVVPFVVGIRTLAFIIMPMILGMSATASAGYAKIFVVFTVLTVIALISACGLSKETIGKK
ncbi:MAG: MFS transporter [Lachnospiraceae bacterium]|nr:MFS transporter [Lachnospiraceae bacterium]